MASYRIKSIDTKFLVAHSGLEHPGQPVISDDGEPHAPPLHHHLTFSAEVSPANVTIVTIKQWNGLYIGLRGDRLIWTPKAFEWQVAPTGPFYQFYPKDGDNLYWYQTEQILPFVGVKPGDDLVPPQPFFELQRVFD